MEMFLTILSGIGWILVYEECIRIGFQKKRFAMPLFALGLNLAWESTYSVVDLVFQAHGPLIGMNLVQEIVNIFWCVLDIVILYTYIKHGKKEWPQAFSQKLFLPWTVLVLVCSYALQIVFIKQFGYVAAAQYSAFLQNLAMSLLFIELYAKRGNAAGQSILLAAAKWIGTLAPTILFGVLEYNPLVLVCGIFCTIFDVVYIVLLVNCKRKNSEENRV